MHFYTVFSEGRPIRLGEKTRRFAWDALHGRYGDMALQTPYVSVDDVRGFADMTPLQQYDICITTIAEKAPIRICENERISGAATLGYAMYHMVPAAFKGNCIFTSISHVTLGFDKVVQYGMNRIAANIHDKMQQPLSDAQYRQLISMKNAVDAMRLWHGRYMSALEKEKSDIRDLLHKVPFEPASNFHEAVQSLWFAFAFTRLCGNWSGIGRIDDILGDYLRQDLANHTLTIDHAREILASFFIKGCEWIQSETPVGTGDAQHYQNIVLSGIDSDGNDLTNEVTYLVLDIVEELGISDFPITVRINENTSEKLLTRVAEVMRHGGGVIAVYNERLIIESLVDFGYSERDARRFANDGCWEVQIPGETYFSYRPFDSLRVLTDDTLQLSGKPAHFDDMDSLYAAYKSNLRTAVQTIFAASEAFYTELNANGNSSWKEGRPCAVVSIFTEGCIDSTRDYTSGGAKYTVVSPHIGGAPDVGNSLYAIQKLVFDEALVSFDELMVILQNDWQGHEALRQYALNKIEYYGNDNDEADAYTAKVLNDFADMVLSLKSRNRILYPPGVSTFGRQIEWASMRTAVPFGYKKAAILSGNASPTPGTDWAGATSMIKSYCKADLRKQVNGAALDVKLYPSSVQGENGIRGLIALIKGFIKLNGHFMQLDIVDAAALKEAQENPAKYKTLSVRISGWNARFVTLHKDWQDMIIQRSTQGW